MRPRIQPSPALLRLAADHAGVLTTQQAASHGLGRHSVGRLVNEGSWRRLADGIYWTGPDPASWLGLAWAGVVLGGPGARLGGAAAAHLHGLVDDPPQEILVLVPHATRRVSQKPWRFARERPGVRLGARGAPPRTRVEDTVLDLCATADTVGVIDALTRAVQRRRTTTQRLARRLDERGPIANRQLIGRIIADVVEGAQSPLELDYLRDVERAHGLPRGRRQARSAIAPRQLPRADRRGAQTVEYRDVVYDEFATVVELDGVPGHSETGRLRDMDRDNRALLLGLRTLRFG